MPARAGISQRDLRANFQPSHTMTEAVTINTVVSTITGRLVPLTATRILTASFRRDRISPVRRVEKKPSGQSQEIVVVTPHVLRIDPLGEV
jgi:hypothetical protein